MNFNPDKLRRRFGQMLTDAAFHTAARIGGALPQANPAKHGVEVFYDVPYQYTGMPEHRLDVYRPASPTASRSPLFIHGEGTGVRSYPIVFYVHGGGFRMLSKDTHWVMGLSFARRGYLVFNISYRLAPQHPYPAALEDTCEALLWVLRNAHSYGGDVNRLIFAGESAGANLVTALAVASCFERPEPFAQKVFAANPNPRAVVASCGMLQVSDAERFHRRKPIPRYVRDRLEEVEHCYLQQSSPDERGRFGLADPLLCIEHDKPVKALPPFFAPVGTADPLLHDTRRLHEALTKKGSVCEAKYYPNEIHAFHALVFRKQAMQCWRDTFSFLQTHVP